VKISKTLYAQTAKDWRAWLEKHYKSEKEIWLIYYKKNSDKPRISYNDAVEEALCFGWIDSIVKGIDNEKYAQRFSPRNSKSPYSQANKERLAKLIKKGRVVKDVLNTLGDMVNKPYIIPQDILEEIKKDKTVWENFQQFSDEYGRIRTAFIDGARSRPKEFKKRLNYFINMTGKNKQFGFGGIQKYY